MDDRFKIQENFKRLRKNYILQNICQIPHLDKKKTKTTHTRMRKQEKPWLYNNMHKAKLEVS